MVTKEVANTGAIRGLNPTLERFPRELKSQQFQVVRIILPESAKAVGCGSTWSDSHVALQLLGAFSTLEKAKDYANTVMEIQDWADVTVYDMYEWITLPPNKTLNEIQTADPDDEGYDIEVKRHDPVLQEYCSALKKSTKDDAMIMKMRIQAARDGKTNTQEIMTKEHAEWAKIEHLKQVKMVIDDPSNFPASMLKGAQDDWDAASDELKAQIVDDSDE